MAKVAWVPVGQKLRFGVFQLTVEAPAGSRRKGYEDIVVQDLMLRTETTLYRRERWETPDGRQIVAPLLAGIVGGYGPQLRRLILMLHVQGQMTFERIVTLLTGLGVAISKRQLVRLMTADLVTFSAEDARVLRTGLASAPFVTVDDTGARHAGKACFTTQIGSDRFAVFRTGPSKSRLAFLRNLMGGVPSYVINAAALAYMRASHLAQGVIDALAGADVLAFPSHDEWTGHLRALGVTELKVAPDPVRAASEAAMWGAIEEQGLIGRAVIVSDDAGQFRVGEHALCWVHAERLVHKLVPANDRQRNAIEVARRMIWWFYRQLKDYKSAPNPQRATELSARFERIFTREPATPPSTASSNACSPESANSCACSSGRKSLSTPTPPKTTSGPASPSAKSPAEPSPKKAAALATSCSASPRRARNSKSRSSTTLAIAWVSRDPEIPDLATLVAPNAT